MSFSSWFRWLRSFLSSLAGEWHTWRRKRVYPPPLCINTPATCIPQRVWCIRSRNRRTYWPSLNERRMAWGIA